MIIFLFVSTVNQGCPNAKERTHVNMESERYVVITFSRKYENITPILSNSSLASCTYKGVQIVKCFVVKCENFLLIVMLIIFQILLQSTSQCGTLESTRFLFLVSLNQKVGVKGDFLSKTVELASIRGQKQPFCVGFLKIHFKNILF